MRTALRAALLDFTDDPSHVAGAARWVDDGLLVMDAGGIASHGAYADVAPTLSAQDRIEDLRGMIVTPGFIDAHLHLPQVDIIASPAPGLLQWLERHTYPAEAAFADPAVCDDAARFFLDELARQGTTSACVLGSVHAQSVESLFAQAHTRSLRLVAGKCLMDAHAPANLRDTADGGVQASADLAARWHDRGRLAYAITPRFAGTSSRRQLELAGALASAQPGLYIQSHVAESVDEVRWISELFPQARSYLDVYDHHGLLRERALFAHCIHLDAADRARMAASGAVAAVCPTSNLFLGSGLFDFAAALDAGMTLALGTDVGGGQSFSMFSAMRAAHEVARLRGHALTALQLWHWATRGAALALGWGGKAGTLEPGTEADVIVIDPAATPLLARRTREVRCAQALEQLLFALLVLGDDRAVHETYIAGRPAKRTLGARPTTTSPESA